MPTHDDAAALTLATREVMDARSSDRGDWPVTVEIEEIEAKLVDGELVVLIRYADTRYPELELGARFTVGPTFWTGRSLDAEWAASHAAIYFGETTFAGGDPRSRASDADGSPGIATPWGSGDSQPMTCAGARSLCAAELRGRPRSEPRLQRELVKQQLLGDLG